MTRIGLPRKQSNTPPSRHSAWEAFLLGAKVVESNCMSLVSRQTRKGRAIRSWVRHHYQTHYVPESILDVLGLGRQLRLRWQREK